MMKRFQMQENKSKYKNISANLNTKIFQGLWTAGTERCRRYLTIFQWTWRKCEFSHSLGFGSFHLKFFLYMYIYFELMAKLLTKFGWKLFLELMRLPHRKKDLQEFSVLLILIIFNGFFLPSKSSVWRLQTHQKKCKTMKLVIRIIFLNF